MPKRPETNHFPENPVEQSRLKLMEPLQDTIRFVRSTLFGQFHWNKWLIWGVLAFLGTNLGSGLGWGYHGLGTGGGDSGTGGDLTDIMAWVNRNLELVLLLLVIALVVFLVVSVLFLVWLYIACRGRFMFLECLVENKTAMADSWRNNGRQAMSLFWWFNGYYSVVFLAIIAALAGAFFILYRDDGWAPLAEVWPQLLLLGAGLLVAIVLCAIVSLYLEDFVVPLMWARKLKVLDAYRVFLQMFRAQPGSFLLYLPIRLGLSLGAGILLFIGTCLTCCLAALPVVGHTLFLPVYAGLRMYPVYVLAQLEPALQPRLDLPAGAQPPAGPSPPADIPNPATGNSGEPADPA
jgi:hypothetical protein